MRGCTETPASPSSVTWWQELKDQCHCWTTRIVPPLFYDRCLNSDTRGHPNAAKQQHNFFCTEEKNTKKLKLHEGKLMGGRKRTFQGHLSQGISIVMERGFFHVSDSVRTSFVTFCEWLLTLLCHTSWKSLILPLTTLGAGYFFPVSWYFS